MIKTTEKSIFAIFIVLVITNSCTSKNELENYNLTTSAQPTEAGKVTPAAGSFTSDTDVTIVATANEGFVFKTWAGASTGSSNSLTLNMDSDKQLTAIFEKLDSDGDGVSDDVDTCANTPAGETVDTNGCSDNQKDTDSDGVTDQLDNCPDTLEGETVDENGCSPSQIDTDGDGVTDDIDQCQNTPSGETVDSEGCSDTQIDSDGDTVTDDFDDCLNTPTGETVDENGCSTSQKDTDGDGVTDDTDTCENTPTGELVDSEGCSTSQKDTDGDGVTDDLDQCQNTAEGESVNAEGCATNQSDTDDDGVVDDLDECPDTPSGETVEENGCSTSQIDTDGDGVFDDADQCDDTAESETVDENGCSQAQSDSEPPSVTSIEITDITSTSFTVDWSLDENSKGYIQIGTSPGSYAASTTLENNFLDRHLQTVGGVNSLNPETTYYWRIYVEDQYGNTGFSEEQTTTTLAEVSKTYVPDDNFEQALIDLGYDDVLDDYVLTAKIEDVVSLSLDSSGDQGYFTNIIDDFTGIQHFTSLETLSLRAQTKLTSNNIDLSNNAKLKELYFQFTSIDGINLSKNLLLESVRFQGGDVGEPQSTISNFDLSSNTNLKLLFLNFVRADDATLNSTIASATSIEDLTVGNSGSGTLNLVNNVNLKKLWLFEISYVFKSVDLKNGANEKLEEIKIGIFGVRDLCIEVDLVSYVNSITNIEDYTDPYFNVRVTSDCSN